MGKKGNICGVVGGILLRTAIAFAGDDGELLPTFDYSTANPDTVKITENVNPVPKVSSDVSISDESIFKITESDTLDYSIANPDTTKINENVNPVPKVSSDVSISDESIFKITESDTFYHSTETPNRVYIKPDADPENINEILKANIDLEMKIVFLKDGEDVKDYINNNMVLSSENNVEDEKEGIASNKDNLPKTEDESSSDLKLEVPIDFEQDYATLDPTIFLGVDNNRLPSYELSVSAGVITLLNRFPSLGEPKYNPSVEIEGVKYFIGSNGLKYGVGITLGYEAKTTAQSKSAEPLPNGIILKKDFQTANSAAYLGLNFMTQMRINTKDYLETNFVFGVNYRSTQVKGGTFQIDDGIKSDIEAGEVIKKINLSLDAEFGFSKKIINNLYFGPGIKFKADSNRGFSITTGAHIKYFVLK